jgi:hypothetical protein
MMRKIIYIATIFFFFFYISAQGCSDAGICSINHGFQNATKKYRNLLEVAAIYSKGEADVAYFSPYISYTKLFNERFSFTSKVTMSTTHGSFGTRTQLGDAFLVGNYSFKERNNSKWSTLLGFKFPFTAANLKINNYALPLDYQSSLGTIDLFLGGNLHHNHFDFNVALQLPVVNLNKNSFFKEYSGSNDFPSTNLFKRQPDALLRATYSINSTNSKFTFRPNLLFVYHLGEDSFENILGQRENIKGSDGLTINGNLVSIYHLNNQNQLELSIATPFVVRTIRPDGLTRSLVLGLQYQYSF